CTTWQVCMGALWELCGVSPAAETTRQVDGSTAESTRQPDGSICETTRQVDGSTAESTRQPDGSICSHIRNESSNGMGGINVIPMNHGDDGALEKPKRPIVQKWIDRQLTAEDLVDADSVGDLFNYAVASNRWPAGERGEHEFFTLCVHCAEAADNAGALLTGVVFLGKTAKPTNAQEQRAEQLLLTRRRKQPRPQSPAAAVVARVADGMTPAPPPRRSLQEVFDRLKAAAREESQP
ncbi:MAG: hypothetical protein KGL39_32680, partial [Patescibacteria group bacterium]|nr:hypothetical protein [Patescibacteria group bacterium]